MSIIITSYNYGHTIAAAIESASAQDYPNLEILILDNASTDSTHTVLEQYRDRPNIRIISHSQNLGATRNHNLGVQLAQGEYLRFLSADDVLKPDSISRTYSYLAASPQIDIPYTEIEFIDLNGIYVASRHSLFPAGYQGSAHEFAHFLSYGCYAAFETLLVHRTIWEKYGPLDESFTAADFEIVVRWAAAGLRFGYLPYASLQFRVHDMQDSGPRKYLATGKSIRELLSLYTKYLEIQNGDALRGHEYAIQRHFSQSYALAQAQGYVADAHIAKRIEAFETQLTTLRLHNESQPFLPKLSLIVLATASVADVHFTLHALARQSIPDWEVLIVHPPELPLGPVDDPSGRIRLVSLYAPTSEGHALNTGIYHARGNCYAFLRAGNTFHDHHCAQLLQAFQRSAMLCVLTPAQLSLRHSQHEEIHPIFQDFMNRNAVIIAPTCPLESIAFTMPLIDRLQGFIAEDAVSATWDLQLRLRDAEQHLLAGSRVYLHEQNALPNRFGRYADPVADIQRIYTRWNTANVRVREAREAYLQEYQEAVASHSQSAMPSMTHGTIYHHFSAYDIVRRYGLAPSEPVLSTMLR